MPVNQPDESRTAAPVADFQYREGHIAWSSLPFAHGVPGYLDLTIEAAVESWMRRAWFDHPDHDGTAPVPEWLMLHAFKLHAWAETPTPLNTMMLVNLRDFTEVIERVREDEEIHAAQPEPYPGEHFVRNDLLRTNRLVVFSDLSRELVRELKHRIDFESD